MKTTDKPRFQDFQIEGVKHISPDEAYKLLSENSAVLIDVREEHEIMKNGVGTGNVLYHPMSLIMDRIDNISPNQNIITGCPGGIRSTKVANLLQMKGFQNVANLDGGYDLWRSKGLPWENHTDYDLPEGCGSGCAGCGSAADSKGCC